MSARNNPFEMIERMFEQMSRQFDEAARLWESEGVGERGLAAMGIDLADRGDEFVVTADVPGFEKDEIDLRIIDTTLLVKATRERSTESSEETYLRSERQQRTLSERVRLPEPVREEDIEAKLTNGVLTIRLPKIEPTETGGRRIEIE